MDSTLWTIEKSVEHAEKWTTNLQLFILQSSHFTDSFLTSYSLGNVFQVFMSTYSLYIEGRIQALVYFEASATINNTITQTK